MLDPRLYHKLYTLSLFCVSGSNSGGEVDTWVSSGRGQSLCDSDLVAVQRHPSLTLPAPHPHSLPLLHLHPHAIIYTLSHVTPSPSPHPHTVMAAGGRACGPK